MGFEVLLCELFQQGLVFKLNVNHPAETVSEGLLGSFVQVNVQFQDLIGAGR